MPHGRLSPGPLGSRATPHVHGSVRRMHAKADIGVAIMSRGRGGSQLSGWIACQAVTERVTVRPKVTNIAGVAAGRAGIA